MNPITTAREALLTQLAPLQQQADALKEQLDAVVASKAQLEAALVALEPAVKAKSKTGRKPAKPCAKKPDVEAVCVALLRDNGTLSQSELEELAKDKLAEELGFSLSGFGLRFKECLASARFALSGEGVVSLNGETIEDQRNLTAE